MIVKRLIISIKINNYSQFLNVLFCLLNMRETCNYGYKIRSRMSLTWHKLAYPGYVKSLKNSNIICHSRFCLDMDHFSKHIMWQKQYLLVTNTGWHALYSCQPVTQVQNMTHHMISDLWSHHMISDLTMWSLISPYDLWSHHMISDLTIWSLISPYGLWSLI